MNARELEASSTPVVDDDCASLVIVGANPDRNRAVIPQYGLEDPDFANWVIGNHINCMIAAVVQVDAYPFLSGCVSHRPRDERATYKHGNKEPSHLLSLQPVLQRSLNRSATLCVILRTPQTAFWHQPLSSQTTSQFTPILAELLGQGNGFCFGAVYRTVHARCRLGTNSRSKREAIQDGCWPRSNRHASRKTALQFLMSSFGVKAVASSHHSLCLGIAIRGNSTSRNPVLSRGPSHCNIKQVRKRPLSRDGRKY